MILRKEVGKEENVREQVVLFCSFGCVVVCFFSFKASHSCRHHAVAIWLLPCEVREHLKRAWQSNFLDLNVPVYKLLPV